MQNLESTSSSGLQFERRRLNDYTHYEGFGIHKLENCVFFHKGGVPHYGKFRKKMYFFVYLYIIIYFRLSMLGTFLIGLVSGQHFPC